LINLPSRRPRDGLAREKGASGSDKIGMMESFIGPSCTTLSRSWYVPKYPFQMRIKAATAVVAATSLKRFL
jgi:hypothetical protein